MEPLIDVNDFSFSYGLKTVLENVHFKVFVGEVIGLLGENGSGKTTFLDSLYGFHGKQESIKIFCTMPEIDNQLIKNKVSYVQDTPNLLDYLTAEQYIKFICFIEKISFNDYKKEIMRFINLFDLGEEFNMKILKNYSFGMKKKIQIIGELFLHKEVIIIDEPTNGLDIKMIILLKKLLQDQKSCHTTLIISSHNTRFLEEICTRVLLFNNKTIEKEIDINNGVDLEEEFLKIKNMKKAEKYEEGY